MIPHTEIDAVILAGGKSSRMGEEKGLVLFQQKPLVSYVINLLLGLQIQPRLIANHPGYQQFNIRIDTDIIPDKGPMGGLYTALETTRQQHVLLLSCDTPFLQPALIKRLLSGLRDGRICIPECQGRLHPLCAIYPKSLKDKVVTCITENRLRMTAFVSSAAHDRIHSDDLEVMYPDLFMNLNDRQSIHTWMNKK
jgi:molybdopterin-guanine dinucleotide biosynthesis protein A